MMHLGLSDYLNVEYYPGIDVITVTSALDTQTRLMGHFPLY